MPCFQSNLFCNWPLTESQVRASSQQPRLYMGMVLILIFSEVLGLYGFVISLLMITKSKSDVTKCLY